MARQLQLVASLLVLCAVVAVGSATAGRILAQPCSKEDRQTVMNQWNSLTQGGVPAQLRVFVTKYMMELIMAAYPDAITAWKKVESENTNGPVFAAHSMRIFNSLDVLVNLLGNPQALEAALDHLVEQHVVRPHVRQAHFLYAAHILTPALKTALPAFDAMSWQACLTPMFMKLIAKLPA